MKINNFAARKMFAICIFAATAMVFAACGDEKKSDNPQQGGSQEPEKVSLVNTRWVADTNWAVPSIPGFPIPQELANMSFDFTSTLNFTSATDGFYTMMIDIFGRTDTMNYTYTFDGVKGGTLASTDFDGNDLPFSYNNNKINIKITQDLIPGADTNAILAAAFAYINAQGGLSFNYYKK